MAKKQPLNLKEIESAVYGADGLYSRVVSEIEKLGTREAKIKTGKKQQHLSIFVRQFKFPEKYESRPKLDSIKEMAEKLGVE